MTIIIKAYFDNTEDADKISQTTNTALNCPQSLIVEDREEFLTILKQENIPNIKVTIAEVEKK